MAGRLAGKLAGWIDIRRGEWALAALMLANYFTLLVTYYFIKPARDSLFLFSVDPQMLPLVFIIIAVVTVPIIGLYTQLGRRLRLDRLIGLTTLLLVAMLVGFRWLVVHDQEWIFYLFYTWVSIYGILVTSQFWLMANAVLDSAQAKRIFPLLALSGIAGAIAGGEITGLVVDQLGVATEDLLLLAAGLLALTLLLVRGAWRRRAVDQPAAEPAAEDEDRRGGIRETWRTVRSSRHLLLVIGVVAATMAVASFVDYQFKIISRDSISEQSQLTAFLGKFYARVSLASLLVQALLASRVLRWLGVGGTLLLLPLVLLASSTAILVAPGLVTAVMLRGSQGTIKYSLDKTARELLFLPVPLAAKKKAKVFIDTVVDRWFRGLAGGLLLLLTLVVGMSVRQLSLVVIGLVLGWMVLAFKARRQYVQTFRQALERREIDPERIRAHIATPKAAELILAALDDASPRRIVYNLKLLHSVRGLDLGPRVVGLLDHATAAVRLEALRLLNSQQIPVPLERIDPLLADSDAAVQAEAVHALGRRRERPHSMQKLLDDERPAVRAAALAHLAEHGRPEDTAALDPVRIRALLDDRERIGPRGRASLARVMAKLGERAADADLERLLADPAPEAAAAAATSIARLQRRRFIPHLTQSLTRSHVRPAARRALAAFGDSGLEWLADRLRDPQLPPRLRRQLPRAIAAHRSQPAVQVLVAFLPRSERWLEPFVVRALSKLRAAAPALAFEPAPIEDQLRATVQRHHRFRRMRALLDQQPDESPAGRLLRRAVGERGDETLELTFRLLGLLLDPDDMRTAYLATVSTQRRLRAGAIEFADNLLPVHLKGLVMPVLDQGEAGRWDGAEPDLASALPDRKHVLRALLSGRDAWLQACAVFNTPSADDPELDRLVDRATRSPEPIVRETAQLVTRRRAEIVRIAR